MDQFIPLSVPNIKGNEKAYVVDAIEKEWVSTGGSYISDFESKIASYLGVSSAVACQSGTSGIHLALKVLGVGTNDEVIVPTLTFIAAVNPVTYCGANPVFIDCDDTLNLDIAKVEDFLMNECDIVDGITINRRTKSQIKAVIYVHIFGNIGDLSKLMDLAAKYNFRVIEDATEALGSFLCEGDFANKYAGTMGDFGVYSFNGNKIITTGGGGMIVANDESRLMKAKYLSTQAKDDEFAYIHDEIGYNYRMTNVQAAIGVGQFERLEEFIENKNQNYDYYKQNLQGVEGLELLDFNPKSRSNKWFYSIVIDEKALGRDKEALIKEFNERKIQVRPIWGLIHEQKPYRGFQAYKIEKAIYYSQKILNIPCSTNITQLEMDRVIAVLKKDNI